MASHRTTTAPAPYAVIRMQDSRAELAIAPQDIFLTMAVSDHDAYQQAGEIGWRTSIEAYNTAVAMANPAHVTGGDKVYSRPVHVENTLGSVMRYLMSSVTTYVPEYMATRVHLAGDSSLPETTPYILAVGGTRDPFVPPRVVCCYAMSYAEVIATISLSTRREMREFMGAASMDFYPQDIIAMREDPFDYRYRARANEPSSVEMCPRHDTRCVVARSCPGIEYKYDYPGSGEQGD